MLVGLHGVLDLVGLVEDHGGHQDDHRDGEPRAEGPAGEERDDDDAEGADAADDDGDLEEGEVQVCHEDHGRQGGHEGAGGQAGRDEDFSGVTLGDIGGIVDQRDEDQRLQEHVDAEAGILRGPGGTIEGQGLGDGGPDPEEDHHPEHAQGTDTADAVHEGSGDAAHEEGIQGEGEGAERNSHQAVGATEEGGAIGGRGVGNDEGIGFHTSHLIPFPRQSSPWASQWHTT